MAVDPAMVGFQVVDNLQNTLLNYVMQNRRMQQQDRQFNTQMNMEQNRLNEMARQANIREGRLDRQEQRIIDRDKAGADTFREFFNVEKTKREADKYKRDRLEFITKQKKDPMRTDLLNIGGYTPYGDPLGITGGKKEYERRVEDLLTKEFESRRGKMPEVSVPTLPDYGFVPQYAPELLSLYRQNNPNNILNQAQLNQLLQRLGG